MHCLLDINPRGNVGILIYINDYSRGLSLEGPDIFQAEGHRGGLRLFNIAHARQRNLITDFDFNYFHESCIDTFSLLLVVSHHQI